MAKGGKRPGAGRPKGRKDNATLEKERVLEAMRQRIMGKADDLLNAQFSLAQGNHYLFRIDTETDSKGKRTKGKPELVTDPEEIRDYLDQGPALNTETEYYFMTTATPDNQAINSLMDRTFGRPTQSVEVDQTSTNLNFNTDVNVDEESKAIIDGYIKDRLGEEVSSE